MNQVSTGNELVVDQYAKISAIQGTQFGRDFYSSVLSFKDLRSFLEVFPEVQRGVNLKKVNAIKKYILSGLSDAIRSGTMASYNMRFFPAITASARGFIFYDASKKAVAIDVKESKLSVNDGQHRFFATLEAINDLGARFNQASPEKKAMAQNILEELNNMSMPLIIFNNVSVEEEKQMFHDFNTLALRPSRSSTIRLAQTDLASRISRELAQENEYLVKYGVEMGKMSIHKNNPHFILLTTIHHMVNLFEEYGKQPLTEDNYDEHKAQINNWFNLIFESLPTDLDVKGKYILEKGLAFRGIAKFIVTATYVQKRDEDTIRQTIQTVKWENDANYWYPYGVSTGKGGEILFSGDGKQSIYKCLMDKLPPAQPNL